MTHGIPHLRATIRAFVETLIRPACVGEYGQRVPSPKPDAPPDQFPNHAAEIAWHREQLSQSKQGGRGSTGDE